MAGRIPKLNVVSKTLEDLLALYYNVTVGDQLQQSIHRKGTETNGKVAQLSLR